MTRLLNELTKTAQTWNGATSYSTTGMTKYSCCLDYFAKAGTYTNRPQSLVDVDMSRIFGDDEDMALSIVFGLRLITRKVNGLEIQDAQTGYGRRDEFYKAIVWLHNNKPELLYKNLHLIPVFGCWKDFFNEPLITTLDKNKVFDIVKNNLTDDLLLKYLPQIRSTKNVRSTRDGNRIQWAKEFCQYCKISFKTYRQMKSGGKAHIWQKQMGNNAWDKVNFNGIPGKAIFNHTTQKGKKDGKTVFERHGQIERLKEWVLSQKTVKFTGYPYELTKAASSNPSIIQKLILDRQFETVIEPMSNHKLGNVLACLDTSGSMQCPVTNNASAYDICLSMGVVFSQLNVGYFKDVVCMFDSQSRLLRVVGGMCDRINQITSSSTAWGSTNFQSVIDLLVETRLNKPEIPVSEYPETIIVVSDMQFNPVGGNAETNYEAAMRKFNSVGLNKTRIIWWYVNGAASDFPCQMDSKGCYIIGGFDPVNIKSLMGLTANKPDFNSVEKVEQTPLDGLINFVSQPIFKLLSR